MTKWTSQAVLLVLVNWGCAQENVAARKPPKITEPLARRTEFVQHNQHVTLQCRADGIPDVVYEWLWNDNPINSQVITFDASTGTLQIKGMTEREEGFFHCKAKNTYKGQEAVAVSPKIEVRIAHIDDFPPEGETKTYTFTEGNYARVPCDENVPNYYGPTKFKWYKYKPGESELREVLPDERIYVDELGSLHFAYITKADENKDNYQCALSNTMADVIKLGKRKQVVINRIAGGLPDRPDRPPVLEYKSEGDLLVVDRNDKATLECFFSGHERNPDGKVPTVTWYDNEGNQIRTGGRHTIKSEGRVLEIQNVVETDEKIYRCEGRDSQGRTAEGQLLLNVTSSPIWVQPPRSMTVPEGRDAVFNCVARSAVSENKPEPPEWYKNGVRMVRDTDSTKYVFSEDNTRMTVSDVSKERDIACFQCYVENSRGREFSQGCLNVILPITVTVQPDLDQKVEHGDIVNLTVVATSDVQLPVSYRWHFKSVRYEQDRAPPYVTYTADAMLAFINTSLLTEKEYAKIDGVYSREIYHQYQSVFVNIQVTTKALSPPELLPVIIGVAVSVLVVAVVIILTRRQLARMSRRRKTYSDLDGGREATTRENGRALEEFERREVIVPEDEGDDGYYMDIAYVVPGSHSEETSAQRLSSVTAPSSSKRERFLYYSPLNPAGRDTSQPQPHRDYTRLEMHRSGLSEKETGGVYTALKHDPKTTVPEDKKKPSQT